MSWLDSPVSVFASATATTPSNHLALSIVLNSIRDGEYRSVITRLRPFADAAELAWRERNGQGNKTEPEHKYDAQKKQLPAATFSGQFSYRRESSLERHSGILLVDLDHVEDLDSLRLVVEFDPHTAFCFISPSGHGLKVGLRIDPERHRESFAAAETYYREMLGAELDKACKDPSRLCFLSWDDALYVNPDAVVLEIPERAPEPERAKPSPATSNSAHRPRFTDDDAPSIDEVRELLQYVPSRPAYPEWIRIISAVANVLSVNDAISVLNEWSPEEREGEYAAKIAKKLEAVSYGTLVWEAQQRGYVRERRHQATKTSATPDDAPDAPPPGDDDAPDTTAKKKGKEPPPPIDVSTASTLSELAPAVNARLNQRTSRVDKQHVATRIIDWLGENDRLLCDISDSEDPFPYILTDDGSAIGVVGESKLLKSAINEAGINASEPAYNWLVNDLQARAMRDGRRVILEHFRAIRDDAIYVSCGRRHMVIGRHGEPLRVEPNGTDGVLFAAEFVLPTWEPTTPRELATLRAFQPNLVAPPEAPDYTPEAQHLLIESWVLAAFMGIKPLPILVPIGQKGSGKSTTAKIIAQVFQGASADVSPVPGTQRDFNAALAALPLFVIDNMDAEPQDWMVDALANACTGGTVQERKLYTNFDLMARKLSAALAITTRTGVFAERPDLKERVLPIFYGELLDDQRFSDRLISDEAITHRDGILSSLTLEAASLLGDKSPAAGFVSRFQEFAKVATRDPNLDGVGALTAWIKAQVLGVTDNDPLLQAILDYHGELPLHGTATEIVKLLSSNGADIPHQGGGKKIARKIREVKAALMMAGFSVREQQSRDRTYFEIELKSSRLNVGMSEKSETVEHRMF